MARTLRLLGMTIVLVTSLATAVSARERGAIFWASVVVGLVAAFGVWRILKEPAP